MSDNKYCFKTCKHSSYCRLSEVDTNNCKNSDAELDAAFGYSSGDIFGYTSEEIATKQGMRVKDLKK